MHTSHRFRPIRLPNPLDHPPIRMLSPLPRSFRLRRRGFGPGQALTSRRSNDLYPPQSHQRNPLAAPGQAGRARFSRQHGHRRSMRSRRRVGRHLAKCRREVEWWRHRPGETSHLETAHSLSVEETIEAYLRMTRNGDLPPQPPCGRPGDSALESAFVAVVRRYSQRHRIDTETWIEFGVSQRVLRRAGLRPTRVRSRRH